MICSIFVLIEPSTVDLEI